MFKLIILCCTFYISQASFPFITSTEEPLCYDAFNFTILYNLSSRINTTGYFYRSNLVANLVGHANLPGEITAGIYEYDYIPFISTARNVRFTLNGAVSRAPIISPPLNTSMQVGLFEMALYSNSTTCTLNISYTRFQSVEAGQIFHSDEFIPMTVTPSPFTEVFAPQDPIETLPTPQHSDDFIVPHYDNHEDE